MNGERGLPERERVILFFFIVNISYNLLQSMLLYQEKRKKSRGPSKTIRFRNTDIRTVFEIIQMIYERDYKKMNAFIVWRKRIDTELALVEYV